MLGLETALSIVQQTMVDTGLLDWAGVAERMSYAPARIGRVADHGRPIEVGEPANVVLYDPAATAHDRRRRSRRRLSRNTPYRGMELPGRVVATFLRGKATVLDGKLGLMRPPESALLVLEDGRTFRGEAYGAEGETFGEAVFNTGMTGYQETLTDPSYHRQVVVMTAPHIGNTGVNDEDQESCADLGRRVRRARPRPPRLQLALAAQPRRRAARPGRRRHLRHRHPRADPPPARARRDARSASPRPRPTRARCWSGCASPAEMTGAELAGEVSTTEAYVVPARRREAVHRRRRSTSASRA